MEHRIARWLPGIMVAVALSVTTLTVELTRSAPAPAPPAPTSAVSGLPSRVLGVSLAQPPTTASGVRALTRFESATGMRPNLVGWFQSFDTPLDPASLNAVAARGAVPMVTWELWEGAEHMGGSRLMQAIIDGEHDLRLHRFMVTAARYGGTVIVRLGHEMNGDWYPWSPGVEGTTAAQYVAVWRHIVDLARTDGALNIRWLWAPNVTWGQHVPLASVYPGDAYVTWVGLSGLWNREYHLPPDPRAFFGPSIAELRRVSTKPLVLAETAATVEGRDAFAAGLVDQARRGVTLGFVWLQQASFRGDWRLRATEPSLASGLEAWRQAGAPITRR